MNKNIGQIVIVLLNISVFLFLIFFVKDRNIQNNIDEVDTVQTRLIKSINSVSDLVFQVVAKDADLENPIKHKRGSALLISKDGYVITNKHVVENPDTKYNLIDIYGNIFDIKEIWRDDILDLAIMKINFGDNFKKESDFISLNDSVNIGEFVFAIGTPLLEFPNTVSFGIISAKGRKLEKKAEYQMTYYQTDLAINYGNSGGPVVNMGGKVIGLVSAISREGNNISFILPLNQEIIDNLLLSIKNKGYISKAYLGISYNEDLSGTIVDTIFVGSPAQGLLFPGDKIVAIDNNDISIGKSLLYHLYSYKAGDKVIVKIFRKDQLLTIPIILGEKIL